ncbi:hypothetical protein BJ742DRAFT_767792 [Cladochytrium replicatum]|nr:hypothetical protein BJ742DRAFT_767792 [Cladochytrium replicatum]
MGDTGEHHDIDEVDEGDEEEDDDELYSDLDRDEGHNAGGPGDVLWTVLPILVPLVSNLLGRYAMLRILRHFIAT